MTTRTLFIGSVVGVGFLLSLAVVVIMRPENTSVTPPPAAITPLFPVGQPLPPAVVSATTLNLPLQTGEIEIRNFMQDPDVKADTVNPGFYYLDDTNAAAPYSIQYIAQTGHFTVSLEQMPLKKAREAAEEYLLLRLNIAPEELCNLRHTVAVPGFVSEEYSSRDLGFSMCPDSVVLP